MVRNIILLVILISGNVLAQSNPAYLYELDKKIRQGDFEAFVELGNYFDSEKSLTEMLGHHVYNSTEAIVSKRIARENSFFLESEIIIDSALTARQFREFCNKNRKEIVFNKMTDAFILTPFENRNTNFQVQELSPSRWEILNSHREELLSSDWVKTNNIDELIRQKKSEVLLKLSSLLLKNRNRFNEYAFIEDEIGNLIRLLTGTNIIVPDKTGRMSHYPEKDFFDTSKVNLLIFFANNFKDYEWNETQNHFENTQLNILKTSLEKNLFDALFNKNDSIAINSLIQLTQSDPENVIPLTKNFGGPLSIFRGFNPVIPSFPDRFLIQLVKLTDYCWKNNIDFTGSPQLKNHIELLKSDLTFRERRKLENKLINELTPDDITAFEYWCLIYQNEWELTYSAGRILDKFYSKNWKEITKNPLHLKTYLLKSKLFFDLEIIGYSRNYTKKFTGTYNQMNSILSSLQSEDPEINEQANKAIKMINMPVVYKEAEEKDWIGNFDSEVRNFKKSFKNVLEIKDKKKFEKSISELLSQINYTQIGEALNAVESIEMNSNNLYSFMNRDFGFSFIGNFAKPEVRKAFLMNYSIMDEYNLYKYYLLDAGIDFTDTNDNLNFDKIYEILKYDINTAFAGGGGSTRDNGVYAIIKLLELHFNTVLGYPKKLCNSNNMYSCNSRKRANSWINYLTANQLLKKEHNEPISFGL